MNRFPRVAFVALLLSLSVTACKKKAPVVTPQDTGPQTTQRTPETTTRDPGTPVTMVDSAAIKAAIANTERSLAETIYFDYDIADLNQASRDILNTKVQILRDNPDVRIRIEGNCDSRGSNEYNIALGQRRAAAAREYLINRGIAANRIETVSLGEEKPAVQGENEAAWSKNRRDEFITIAGKITKPLGD